MIPSKLKILLLGYGSIGQKHYKILKENFQHDVVVLHHDDIIKCNDNFDVGVICTPTHTHIKTAIRLIEFGIKNIFMEKPLDCSLDFYPELKKRVLYGKITTYVAYPFRFNETIKRLKEYARLNYIISCRTDIKKWYPDGRMRSLKEGGGHLFELSHELDIAEYFAGPYEMYALTKFSNEEKIQGQILIKTFHKGGIEGSIYLDTEAEQESRVVIIRDQTFLYGITDADYIRQFQFFFENLNRSRMMNDIFEAEDLFLKILKINQGIKEGLKICMSL